MLPKVDADENMWLDAKEFVEVFADIEWEHDDKGFVTVNVDGSEYMTLLSMYMIKEHNLEVA